MIHVGDCIEVMAGMEADSVDAVVTDPPYGLEFMGKEWERFGVEPMTKVVSGVPRPPDNPWQKEASSYGYGKRPGAFQAWCEAWGREALRVTKPGGYLLAFGGTRTHHRLVCGLEDAGWIIRDELDWIYASGFPKGKANLKPAHEPIVLARKPGPLRPLAIDECRIPSEPIGARAYADPAKVTGASIRVGANLTAEEMRKRQDAAYDRQEQLGRWPSNVLLSDPELFDSANPSVVGSGAAQTSPADYNRSVAADGGVTQWNTEQEGALVPGYGDSGGYSRFFIVPKSDRGDREPTLRESTDDLYCNCKTVKPDGWQRPDLGQLAQTASTSRARATSEAMLEDGNGSPMTLFGSSTSEPSHQDNRSTTSTATSSTTGSRTSSPSIPSPTSDSTPAASSSMASGGSGAQFAASTANSPTSGGTSPRKAGPTTGDAVPAISERLSKPSVCDDCGKHRRSAAVGGADGVTRAARRNSHPT